MLQQKINLSLQRVEREKKFHNQRFTEPTTRAKKVSRFYRITNSINKQYEQCLLQNCQDETVIEYGCGTGSYAFKIAGNKAKMVIGIDISEVAISIAQSQSDDTSNLSFQVMNAENLEFNNNSINLICGSGILHHLDMEKAMHSIVKVLQPQGRAIFIDPLGHNIFINLFRYLTPAIRSDDEHPLLVQDLENFKKYFHRVEVKYFYLTALVASLFADLPGFRILLQVLENLDQQLFKIPFLKKQAWQVLITLSEPIKSVEMSR